jgi:carboxypeptidase family protein
MYSLTRATALVAAMIVAHAVSVCASFQSQANQNKEPAGSISGRVTLADKPASGVTVMLTPVNSNADLYRPARTTTNEDGRFKLIHVPAGSYLLQTFTPAFVGPNDPRHGPGKAINLNEGETVEGIDIALTRGGVITGRIADAEGQPLVQEDVHLTALNERGQKTPIYLPYSSLYSTDDRGIYRLFGVPPGRYIVSAGTDTTQDYARMGVGNTYYALTYHPGVTDQSRASIIEVTSGSEATGIDITLGRVAKAYSASGRLINADTGKPVAGMNFGYGSLQPNGNGFGTASTTSATSNSRGEFRLDGIMPGHYAAFASSMEETDLYSDPVLFQVTDADVTGLEIKVHRGSSLSGVITVEGESAQDTVPKLSGVGIGVSVLSQSLTTPHSNQITVGPDGSFRAKGLRPGNAHFFIMTYLPPKGLALLRVERDGVEQPDGVEIRAGEQVSGVKVTFGYGTGIIRGQVNVEGGELPEGSILVVSISRVGGKPLPINGATPDTRGRFTFERLLPGDYDISVTSMLPPGPGGRQLRPKWVKQTVSVTNGTEAQVTLVIDLNEKKQ